MQLHYGPYRQTEAETEMCLTVQTDNPEPIYVRQYTGRMRPGSHHFLLYASRTDLPDGVYYRCFAGYPIGGVDSVPEFIAAGITDKQFSSGSLTWLAGLQAPGNLSTPDYGAKGMAFTIPARAQLILNVHYINVTDGSIDQEVWVNVLFASDPSAIREELAFVTLIGATLNIPPKAGNYPQVF